MRVPPVGNKPVRFIDQPEALASCLQDLSRQDTLAFDLEFDNHRHAYGVTLCLIQVATPEACYVIDPMAGLDLSGLYAVFESPGIRKIVHAPGEDLRLLHSLDCYPQNLFDTEVVARLLNYEQTSLSALLREKLDHEMSKGQQTSNWLIRPLTEDQVVYAANDVIWLHRLREVLMAEAEAQGLMPWVAEEQDLLSTTVHRQSPKTNFLKPADLKTLSPQEQYILNELLRFRDEVARHSRLPAYRVMSEDLVRSLAGGTRLPESIPHAPGLHPRYKNSRFAGRLADRLRDIRTAAKDLPARLQRPPRLTPAQQAAGRQAAHDRIHKFAPVQQAMAARYGTFAARFMLSNVMVGEIVKGAVRLGDLKPAYRRTLIREIAGELGIDLSSYA